MRFLPLVIVVILAVACVVLGANVWAPFAWGLVVFAPLALLGFWDLVQTRHSITRNYPIIAHLRFLFEAIRPEIHQYFIERDLYGRQFNRDQRSLIYEGRANI